jgi:hypothetical protein
MWKVLSSIKITDRAQEEVSHQEEEEGVEDLRESQITTQEIHMFTVSIMVENTVRKLAQKPKRTSQEFSKKIP